MHSDDDDKVNAAARAALDDSVEHLDAATRSRLNRMRQQAVAQAAQRRAPWLRWAPVGGMATAAMAAMLWWNIQPSPQTPLADPEALAIASEMELLNELEFYVWLEAEEYAG